MLPLSPQRGAQKCKTAYFSLKSDFAWRKSPTKFLCVKTVARQSCKAFIGLTTCAEMIDGGLPLVPEILVQTADFRSLFVRSVSAITPSGKSSINTNRKFTMLFTMSPRWTSYVVPKPPKWAQKCKVYKIWTISCNNSETVLDRMLVTINH